MIKIAVLRVEERFSKSNDVALIDGCWLRKRRDSVSETFQSSKEPVEVVSIVINQTTSLLVLKLSFVEMISRFADNGEF